LLVPGETAAPGTSAGKSGTPTARTAGAAFTVTVNAVDANWNLVSSVNDTASITGTDANLLAPANAALVGGTKSFSVTFNTAGSQTLTATDVDDGTKSANTSPTITVNPAAFIKLQLLAPGETATPGTPTGKSGTPLAQTAGTAFNVTVNAVDANWNVANTNDAVATTSTALNAAVPRNTAPVAGTKSLSVTLKTAGSATVTASDATHALITASTSPAIAVNVGTLTKLQILAPGEAPVPGSSTGKSGTPTAQTAGTAFTVTVNAVDANW